MIAPTTIAAIRDLPLQQAIGNYVTLKKKGVSWVGSSPFQTEKTPSFSVHPVKGLWKCFSSGHGGRDAISFLMQRDKLDFKEAVIQAAKDNGILVEFETDEREIKAYEKAQEKKKIILPVYEWAIAEFKKYDLPADFLERFPAKALLPFHLGYCPPEGIYTEAKKVGHSDEALEQSGLFGRIKLDSGQWITGDKFTNRVMFPIFDYRGTCIGFSGRIAGQVPGNVPKYMHTPGLDKSLHLYGLSMSGDAIRKNDLVYVVEGPTDAIRWHHKEITNTVAQQGSDFSEDQARILKRYTTNLCLVADNDANKEKNIGLEALHRNAQNAISMGFNVKILIPGE